MKRKATQMSDSSELLDIQVKVFQDSLPDKVVFRNKEKLLTKKELSASRRAVWFIVKKGYALGTAVNRASGSFHCSPSVVKKAIEPLFPENYFKKLQKYKNYNLYDKL